MLSLAYVLHAVYAIPAEFNGCLVYAQSYVIPKLLFFLLHAWPNDVPYDGFARSTKQTCVMEIINQMYILGLIYHIFKKLEITILRYFWCGKSCRIRSDFVIISLK